MTSRTSDDSPAQVRVTAEATAAEPPLSLEEYAALSAEISEQTRPQEELLAERDLDEAKWVEATVYWLTRLGEDVASHGADATLPHVYSEAFSARQDQLGSRVDLTVEQYAQLTVEIQQCGGPAQPLAERGLSTADFLRLSRRFARELSQQPQQAKVFFDSYRAAHEEE